MLAGVALAIEWAIVPTDNRLERTQAMLRGDRREVDQQPFCGRPVRCCRRQDDLPWIRVSWSGDPDLLQERLSRIQAVVGTATTHSAR